MSLMVRKFRNIITYHDPWCNGSSLHKMLGARCYSILGKPPEARLDTILGNNGCLSPTPILNQNFQNVYAAITSIIPSHTHDFMCWNGCSKVTNAAIKALLFEEYPKVDWYNGIWFKDVSLNYAIFCWMAMIRGLKTSENFHTRGIGHIRSCVLCSSDLDSHNHLFFGCKISFNPLKKCLPMGNFSLITPSINQALDVVDSYDHIALKKLHWLIIVVLVLTIWKERNGIMHGKPSSSLYPRVFGEK